MNKIQVPATIWYADDGTTVVLNGNTLNPDFKLEIYLKTGETSWNWIMFSHDDRLFAEGDFSLDGAKRLLQVLNVLRNLSSD